MNEEQHSVSRGRGPSPGRFLRLKEVQHAVGLGRSAIYLAIKRGTFPRPYALSAKARGWDSAEIAAWMSSRVVTGGEQP